VTRRIVVEIGSLVVDGPRLDSGAFEAAVRRELTLRLVGGPGSPRLVGDRAVPVATAELGPREAGAADGIGRAVASAVYRELSR
jgi:hypothetical protein